jgi:hypothetical protein
MMFQLVLHVCASYHVHILSALLTLYHPGINDVKRVLFGRVHLPLSGEYLKGMGHEMDISLKFFIIKNLPLSVCLQFLNFCVLIVKKIKCEVFACFCETTYQICKSFQELASKTLLQHSVSRLLLVNLLLYPAVIM